MHPFQKASCIILAITVLTLFGQAVSASGLWPTDVDIVFFFSPGCKICESVSARLAQEQRFAKCNLQEIDSLELMRRMLKDRGLDEGLAGIFPSVFTETGQLLGVVDIVELEDFFAGTVVKEPPARKTGIFLAGLARTGWF